MNKSLLSEKNAAITIISVCIVLWLLGQVNFLAAVIIAGLATSLLVQLDIKNRFDSLSRRKSHVKEERDTRRGIRSVRAKALNGLPSPVLIINPDHEIAFANTEATDILGASLVGQDAFLFLRQPTLVKLIDLAIRGENDQRETVRYTTSDDRTFDISISPIPSDDDDGPNSDHDNDFDDDDEIDIIPPSYQVMVYFYEVTSLLQTEQMRVDFVANASHELRTPLSSLLGSIETLQGPAADDAEGQKRFLKIMQKEAERMKRLIDDLLSLSRIELSRHQQPSTNINIVYVIEEVIELVIAMGNMRGIRIAPELDQDHALVIADHDQILQVLLNLVVNGVKYADANTILHVGNTYLPDTQQVIVYIRDEGPGIAPEHLARLTERFYRVDTARSRQMGGTGLGLAIVKHILLRHNSNLDIKSSLETGTTFSFKLDMPSNSNTDNTDGDSLREIA